MKIGVFTRNQHRCNTMLASFMIAALKELGHEVITHIHRDENRLKTIVDFAFVFNGKIDNDYADIVHALALRSIPVVYLVDDVDLPLPNIDYVSIFIQQFVGNDVEDKTNIYFPIAELLTMHTMWDSGLEPGKNKRSMFQRDILFYGGTFKDRRDYSIIKELNINSVIIAGDDSRWEAMHDNALVIPTIRDLDRLYKFMSKECTSTILVYDEMHYGKGMPLRFFEGALCNLRVLLADKEGNIEAISDKTIRELYTKQVFLNKLKGLIWTIKQAM